MSSSCKIVIVFFCVSLLYSSLFAGDMTLVCNDEEIVLHENNTWDLVDNTADNFEDSFNITLNDNRVIRISTDYTWRFVEKKELKSIEFVTVKNVSAKGNATHAVYKEASARAMNKAITNATHKLKSSVKNRKLNFAKLKNCVKRVEKDVDKEEKFIDGTGWSVNIEMILDKGSILAVLECEEQAQVSKKK